MAQSSPPSFDCYNINCYHKFPTEQGLCVHLWHSNSCKKYMPSERPYALCREVVADESQQRPGYGVQSTRLNPTMSADEPLFSPYNAFNCDALYGGLDNDNLAFRSDNDDFAAGPDNNDNNELLLLVANNESADKLFASAALIDEFFSSPVIPAFMEQIKARDQTALATLCMVPTPNLGCF